MMPRLGVIERDSRLPDFSTVRARQRLNELRRLVRYRRINHLEMGPPPAWALVLSDLALALRSLTAATTAEQLDAGVHPEIFIEGTPLREKALRAVVGLFWRIDLGEMVAGIDETRLIWPRDNERSSEILSAQFVGMVLEVTSVEREECSLRTIDAVDEDDIDRRRKANREREKARRQSAGALPQAESISSRKPWQALGISRATWYRLSKGRD